MPTPSHRLKINDFWEVDNGKGFTCWLFGIGKRAQSEKHAVNKLCATADINNWLFPLRPLQANGMVEWLNGHIEDVLQSHRFQSGKKLEVTLH